jgi:hypothetical protein
LQEIYLALYLIKIYLEIYLTWGEIEKCMDIADLIDGLPDATGADVSANLALADAMAAA